MDKVIDEKEFIQNFALELTNRTLEQRKEIGKKYYKQLQRAKAKINELIDQNFKIAQKYTKLEQENEELKQENERLKAECERLKKALAIWENAALKQTALKVVEVDKYRQALQEIREIVSKIIDSYIRPYGNFDQLKTILTKINEVIGAE